MNMRYCKSWFWGRRMTNNPISEIEAQKRHARRQEYTVAIGGFEQPTAIVEVVRDFVPVTFFDSLLRSVLTFHFEELEPNRLHLTMAVRRRFCAATPEMLERLRTGRADPKHPWGQFLAEIDQVLDGRTITFKPNGDTYYRSSRHGDSRILQLPGPKWDFYANSEPYPEFGCYEHLLKRDRDLPWGPGLDGP